MIEYLVNPVKKIFKINLYFLFILLLFMAPTDGLADDVGITKARLIQKSEKSYVLETDVTRMLVWAIKAPIFPDRFQVSELAYVNQSGWIVVQATATTTGEPLSAQDEILLPWMRNGAAITVQWLDGSVYQGLFLRSIEGIHIPLRLLMPSAKSLGEVCREHFSIGLNHFAFKWIHLVFAGILFVVLPSRQVFKALPYYTFGQLFSLILVDVGLPGFDLIFSDILGAILISLLAHAAVREKTINQYLPLIFLFGLLHGLSYAHELSRLDMEWDKKLPALFMFNIAIDMGYYITAGVLFILAKIFGKIPHWKKIVSYTTGGLSIVLLLVLFQEHVVAGKTDVLNFKISQIATQFTLPVSQKSQTGGQRPRGARQLTSPIMSYLSVEPYEVRQEILIQARTAVQFLGVNDKGKGSIPIESLAPVKKSILDVVQKANSIMIDGKPAKPILARADYVTLGPAGVNVRPSPIPESLDNGIIGLTLVYETPELADDVKIDWRLFSETVPKIEATATDPFGGTTLVLSPKENVLQWKSRLSGYRVPVIEAIAVEKQKLPVLSILMFFAALVPLIFSIRRKKLLLGRPVLLCVVALGLVLYPFVSFPVDLPFLSQWKPSTGRTATILDGLLTNVYRAFDVRDENRVYDRLAMSVMGDQLTQIYLQNRQSLEFENRGGARANVDEVGILAINKVTNAEDDGFVADAVWTVSGS
ncbi:MAG: HupE/UreJ family protein, partial [Deltaproteobacteria bacterium]|nr:HupE/UreJ family protein [Deltaproteobacteria bacterium]